MAKGHQQVTSYKGPGCSCCLIGLKVYRGKNTLKVNIGGYLINIQSPSVQPYYLYTKLLQLKQSSCTLVRLSGKIMQNFEIHRMKTVFKFI